MSATEHNSTRTVSIAFLFQYSCEKQSLSFFNIVKLRRTFYGSTNFSKLFMWCSPLNPTALAPSQSLPFSIFMWKAIAFLFQYSKAASCILRIYELFKTVNVVSATEHNSTRTVSIAFLFHYSCEKQSLSFFNIVKLRPTFYGSTNFSKLFMWCSYLISYPYLIS